MNEDLRAQTLEKMSQQLLDEQLKELASGINEMIDPLLESETPSTKKTLAEIMMMTAQWTRLKTERDKLGFVEIEDENEF